MKEASVGSQAHVNPLAVVRDKFLKEDDFDGYAGGGASSATKQLGLLPHHDPSNVKAEESNWKSSTHVNSNGTFMDGSYAARSLKASFEDAELWQDDEAEIIADHDGAKADKWKSPDPITRPFNPASSVAADEPFVEHAKLNPERKAFSLASGKKSPGLNPLPKGLYTEPYVDPSRLNIAISCRAAIKGNSPKTARKPLGLQALPSVAFVTCLVSASLCCLMIVFDDAPVDMRPVLHM
jgi:hypothetical protein